MLARRARLRVEGLESMVIAFKFLVRQTEVQGVSLVVRLARNCAFEQRHGREIRPPLRVPQPSVSAEFGMLNSSFRAVWATFKRRLLPHRAPAEERPYGFDANIIDQYL
jgi:hypothetical protein